MAAVAEHLVRHSDGLILLFTPPFDRMPEDPGYIKGYPPGVRENGGQYTHGAAWTVAAFAELGDGATAADLFALINPVNLAGSGAGVHRYRGEPYVMAADVYSEPDHTGRAGWTWYTGSAGWMYRVGLEWILGIHLEGDHLIIDPCIPLSWPEFEVSIRRGTTSHRVTVANPHGVSRGLRGSKSTVARSRAGRPAGDAPGSCWSTMAGRTGSRSRSGDRDRSRSRIPAQAPRCPVISRATVSGASVCRKCVPITRSTRVPGIRSA
jgi:cyclic beta-1,2-glucan synthetase